MSYVTKAPQTVSTYNEASDDVFGELTAFAEPAWYHGYASPYYRESHKQLRLAVRKFIEDKIMTFATEWDEAKITPPHIYKEMGEAGFHLASMYPLPRKEDLGVNIALPGGVPYEEWDAFHDFIFNDEMSRCGSIGFLMAMTSGNQIGLPPVIKFASPKLQREVIEPVLKGDKRICLAITEPDAVSVQPSYTHKLRCQGK